MVAVFLALPFAGLHVCAEQGGVGIRELRDDRGGGFFVGEGGEELVQDEARHEGGKILIFGAGEFGEVYDLALAAQAAGVAPERAIRDGIGGEGVLFVAFSVGGRGGVNDGAVEGGACFGGQGNENARATV